MISNAILKFEILEIWNHRASFSRHFLRHEVGKILRGGKNWAEKKSFRFLPLKKLHFHIKFSFFCADFRRNSKKRTA